MRVRILFAVSVLCLALSVLFFIIACQKEEKVDALASSASFLEDDSGGGKASARRRTPVVVAVEKARPAVVNISTEQVVQESLFRFRGFDDDFFDDFFDMFPRRNLKRQSLGSGVIIDEKGYILTNEHVVMRGTEIKVTLPDNREFEGKLIGADPAFDLAIIKIDVKGDLPSVTMGDSDTLMIGEPVIAIGNPFGLEHTVTTGVVSALKRSIKVSDQKTYSDFIQTDASINPGNSGGPLLNIDGEVIGINTAIIERAQGIGFAIPINRAKRAVRDLLKYGEVKKAWIGLRVQELTPELARQFEFEHRRGALVSDVMEGGPGQKAGIKAGDIVAEIGGAPVTSADDFYDKTTALMVGEKVRFVVYREGRRMEIGVEGSALPLEKAEKIAERMIGVRVSEIGKAEIMRYGLRTREGVVVKVVLRGGFADHIGMETGDVIRQLGSKEIRNMNDFREAVVVASERTSPVMLIQRGRSVYYTTIE
ncbi:MAG: Do family serine endopeptidase [bacterium]